MKKSILITLLSLGVDFQSFAKESGSYIKIGVGYHMPTMQQEMPQNNAWFDWKKADFMESVAKYSLHKGLGPILSFGHMFNSNIGFEIGADYLFLNNSKAWQGVEFDEQTVYDEMKIKSNNLNIYPSIRLAAPVTGKISFYNRTGLVVPLLSRMTKTMTSVFYDTSGVSHKYELTTVTKNRFNIGFTAALGIEVKVSEKISVSAEVAGQLLNVWTKSERITAFKQDGHDNLSSLNQRAIETQYLKEVELYYVNGGGASPMAPFGLSTQNPFHSIGFNISAIFDL